MSKKHPKNSPKAPKPKVIPNNKSGESPMHVPSELNSDGAGILPLTYLIMKATGQKGLTPYQKKKEREKMEAERTRGYSKGGMARATQGYKCGGTAHKKGKK